MSDHHAEIMRLAHQYAMEYAIANRMMTRADEPFRLALEAKVKELTDEAQRLEAALLTALVTGRKLETALAEAWQVLGGKEANWIEHTDEDGALKRDSLTLAGAILFALDAKDAALAEAQKDAERYRWIIANAGRWAVNYLGGAWQAAPESITPGMPLVIHAPTLDAAIDAATAQTSASPPPASEDVPPG